MPERVTLDGTEVHHLRSEAIGQDYLVNVAFPPGYDPVGDPYPVVYLTDGGPAFTAMSAVTPLMHLSGELKPFITAGITYDIKVSLHAITLRNRDLTHSANKTALAGDDMPDWYKSLPQVEPGGAAAFLDFINTQVRPYIRQHFNASDDATYAGYSLGGLFGLFTLFTSPASFQRYVIGSPSIWWNNRDILNLEAAYAASFDDLDAVLFMCSGQLEEPADAPDDSAMVSNMLKLAETLQNRGYQNLRLTHTVLEQETHPSGHPLALLRGLRVLFA